MVYGVVPRLFGRHPLRAVTASLGKLQALGVNVIWLAPLNMAPPGDYGYAVIEPATLRSSLGRPSDLRKLVSEAHARGLHVILDFSTDYLSDKSRYYTDAKKRGRRSPYYSFFQRDKRGNVVHDPKRSNLVKLNYGTQKVWNFQRDAMLYWLENFDIDGFRASGAWETRASMPKFWPWINRQLKCAKPGVLLIAEAPARDPYYAAAGFDAAFDWTEKNGEWAWRAAFDDAPDTAARLRSAILVSQRKVPAAELIFRFLNNSDTGARFLTRYGLQRTRVAVAMLLTLPGLPSLFTGDEIGAQFEPYTASMQLNWRDSYGLREWYGRLIHLRETEPALRSRDLRFLDIAPDIQVLAYDRPAFAGGKSVIVLLNYGASAVRFALPADELSKRGGTGHFTELLTGRTLSIDGRHPTIFLPAYGVQILKAG